jgi:hypothetical protein
MEVAKNTHAQEAATGTSDSYTLEEAGDWETIVANRPQLGEVKEDKPSVGNSSEASSESAEKSSEHSETDPRKPAPTAGNRSPQEETPDNSGADSTGGNTRKTGRASARNTATRKNPQRPEDGPEKNADDFDF